MTRAGPTRLDAIRPPLTGGAAELLHAARRWRALAGEELSRRLPLLDVAAGAWIIGLPSPAWERELASMREAIIATGEEVPPLKGKVMEGQRHVKRAAGREQEAPPPAGSAMERLRWLMEQMGGGDDS